MQLNLRRFRPRYSLRLLLICFVVVAAFATWRRDPLCRRLERLLYGRREPVASIAIIGPQTSGPPAALSPPSPDQVLRALEQAVDVITQEKNVRLIVEPLAEYLDPPEVSFFGGRSQWHHANYNCMIYSDRGVRTVYVAHNHRCVPSAASFSWWYSSNSLFYLQSALAGLCKPSGGRQRLDMGGLLLKRKPAKAG